MKLKPLPAAIATALVNNWLQWRQQQREAYLRAVALGEAP